MTRPDTPAQEHADTVRAGIRIHPDEPTDVMWDLERRAFAALDALLAEVERLTKERDEEIQGRENEHMAWLDENQLREAAEALAERLASSLRYIEANTREAAIRLEAQAALAASGQDGAAT